MKLLSETKDCIYIDNNMLGWLRTCPLHCYYRGSLGLVLQEHTAATYFGTYWHQAQHGLWGRFGETPWSVDRAMKEIEGFDLTMEDESKGRSHRRLVGALYDYMDYTPEETGVSYEAIASEATTILAEEFLSYKLFDWTNPLTGITKPVFYCGVIDRVFDYKGKVFCLDYKTTTWNRIMDAVWAESPQFKGYIWLVSKFLPEEEVNTFILDLFMMQSKVTNKFLRRELTFDPWNILEWERDRITEAKILLEMTTPYKTPSCSDYSGCAYVSLCRQEPEIRPGIIENMYKVKPWDIHGNIPVGVTK